MISGTLLPYQEESVRRVDAVPYPGRALLALDPGLGKTMIANEWVHRNEDRFPALVVSPAAVKFNWPWELNNFFGTRASICESQTPPRRNSGFELPEKVTVINYDILKYWVPYLQGLGIKTLILDECFPYNELVDTELGKMPIGFLVENRVRVKVRSFDLQTREESFRSILFYSKKTRKDCLLRVKHGAGEFVCTENHKIWTETRGYVKAKNLQSSDILRVVRQRDIGIWENILQQKMLHCSHCQPPKSKIGSNEKSSKYLGNRKEDQCSKKIAVSNGGRHSSSEEYFRKNVYQQPVFTPRGSEQDGGNETEKIHLECMGWPEGREWEVDGSSSIASKGTQNTNSIALGIRDCDFFGGHTYSGVPDELQSGHRLLGSETRDRDRRAGACSLKTKSPRSEENAGFTFSRVGSVAVFEQAGTPGSNSGDSRDYVYNIEVEGNHNYFVNGVLVANCQYLSNPKTQRTKAVKAVSKGVHNVLALSATPLTVRPQELFPVLNILWPKEFPAYLPFLTRYCDPKWTPWGMDYSGASNLEELHHRLITLGMVRYRKKDVLKDLPDKVIRVVPIELWDQDQYQDATKDFMSWLKQNMAHRVRSASKAEALTKVGYMLRLCAKLKMKGIVEWANNFLTETDEKLILFAIHHNAIDVMRRRIGFKHVVVDGSVTGVHRQNAIDNFQKDPTTRAIFGNLQACGVGTTLTAASEVGICEYPWRPGDLLQAMDRPHRIGQKNTVFINFFAAAGTIEEDMCKLLQTRQQNISTILDGGKHESELNLHSELLRILEGSLI